MRMHVLHGMEQIAEQLETEAGRMVTTLGVYSNYMMFSLKTTFSHLHTAVVRHTKIAPHLQVVARNVLADLEGHTGTMAFNAVHLRVEPDYLHGKILWASWNPTVFIPSVSALQYSNFNNHLACCRDVDRAGGGIVS